MLVDLSLFTSIVHVMSGITFKKLYAVHSLRPMQSIAGSQISTYALVLFSKQLWDLHHITTSTSTEVYICL